MKTIIVACLLYVAATGAVVLFATHHATKPVAAATINVRYQVVEVHTLVTKASAAEIIPLTIKLDTTTGQAWIFAIAGGNSGWIPVQDLADGLPRFSPTNSPNP